MALMSYGYLEEIGVACDRRKPVPVLIAPNGPPAAATCAPKEQPKSSGAKSDPKAKAKPEPKSKEQPKKEDTKKDAKADAKADKKSGKQAAAPAASSSAPAGPFVEKSPEVVAKMSKEERGAYHKARIAAQQSQQAEKPKVQLTKAQKREIQDAQRKIKDDAAGAVDAAEELIKDLKLQGLTEDQAREVARELAQEAADEGADEESDDEADDLLSSVRRWMNEQAEGKLPSDSNRDFNLKVRFQGHVDSTPPDHITCILHVLCEVGCKGLDLSNPKVSPAVVAKGVGPSIARFAPILEVLYEKIDDVLLAGDVVVQGVRDGVGAAPGANADAREAAAIGCFMAIREIDMIEDEDLLMACKRVEAPSAVLQKFVKFLEEAVASDDEDDESGSGED